MHLCTGLVTGLCSHLFSHWFSQSKFWLVLGRFLISSWRGKGLKSSRAELKNLQLELWLEPARLGLITNTYLHKWVQEFSFYIIASILPIFEPTFLISELKGKSHEPSWAENSSAQATARASPWFEFSCEVRSTRSNQNKLLKEIGL